MKLLVTGGTGFIGSHIAKRLIKEGKSDKIKKGGFGNNYLTKRGLTISIILLLIVGAYKLSLRNKVS